MQRTFAQQRDRRACAASDEQRVREIDAQVFAEQVQRRAGIGEETQIRGQQRHLQRAEFGRVRRVQPAEDEQHQPCRQHQASRRREQQRECGQRGQQVECEQMQHGQRRQIPREIDARIEVRDEQQEQQHARGDGGAFALDARTPAIAAQE
jgi:hypothetical protein